MTEIALGHMVCCVKCKKPKPHSDYPNDKSRPSGKYPYCKPCHSTGVQLRTDKAKAAQYKRDNAERQRAEGMHYRARLKYMYSTTPEAVERLRAEQAGKCAVCGDAPERPLVIDHSHATGKVRGLLCHGCNVAAGFLRERPDAAIALAAYLIQHASMKEASA